MCLVIESSDFKIFTVKFSINFDNSLKTTDFRKKKKKKYVNKCLPTQGPARREGGQCYRRGQPGNNQIISDNLFSYILLFIQ